MKNINNIHITSLVLVTLCLTLLLSSLHIHAETNVNIGVRAHSGHDMAIKKWTSTAKYLNKKVPGYNFIIRPIVEFSDMKNAVINQEVDFVLTNPAAYIELENKHAVTRIATLINRRGDDATNEFGAIIFTHRKRFDINQLSDLKEKSFMGVHPKAFGGWWMALGELKKNNIDPFKVSSKISFAGTQESVVFSVLNSHVDVGTVRTGIVERLARKGVINIDDIKILNQRKDDFSLPHSTDLYPEWPMAKIAQTSPDLAEKVAQALFDMKPESHAAITGGYTGWTIPLSYKNIHDLLKYLKVGAYEEYGEFTLLQVIKKYWIELALLVMFFLMGLFIINRENINNKKLEKSKHILEGEISQRIIIQQELEEKLDEIKVLQGIIPICSYCHSIRNDEGAWDQIEAYLSEHSDVKFSHGICPSCIGKVREDAGLEKNT